VIVHSFTFEDALHLCLLPKKFKVDNYLPKRRRRKRSTNNIVYF
jgi:hypothetical protein